MAACLMDSKPLFHDLGTCLILAGIFFSFEKLKTFCDIKEVYCLSLSRYCLCVGLSKEKVFSGVCTSVVKSTMIVYFFNLADCN